MTISSDELFLIQWGGFGGPVQGSDEPVSMDSNIFKSDSDDKFSGFQDEKIGEAENNQKLNETTVYQGNTVPSQHNHEFHA